MVVFVDQLTIAERDNLHFNMAVGIAHCVSFFRLDKRKESWNLGREPGKGVWKKGKEEKSSSSLTGPPPLSIIEPHTEYGGVDGTQKEIFFLAESFRHISPWGDSWPFISLSPFSIIHIFSFLLLNLFLNFQSSLISPINYLIFASYNAIIICHSALSLSVSRAFLACFCCQNNPPGFPEAFHLRAYSCLRPKEKHETLPNDHE